MTLMIIAGLPRQLSSLAGAAIRRSSPEAGRCPRIISRHIPRRVPRNPVSPRLSGKDCFTRQSGNISQIYSKPSLKSWISCQQLKHMCWRIVIKKIPRAGIIYI